MPRKKETMLTLGVRTSMRKITAEVGRKSEILLKHFLKEHPDLILLNLHGALALDIGDYVVTANKVYAKATGNEVDVAIDRQKEHLLTDIDKIIAKTLVIVNSPERVNALSSTSTFSTMPDFHAIEQRQLRRHRRSQRWRSLAIWIGLSLLITLIMSMALRG